MDSGPGCGGVASFPIVFGDFSRVRVSPLLPDPNLSKVPRGRDGSGCSDLGSIRPRNPQSVPRAGHGPRQSSPLSRGPQEAAIGRLEGRVSELAPTRRFGLYLPCVLSGHCLTCPPRENSEPLRAAREGCVVLCMVRPLVAGMFSGTATPRKVLLETSVHGRDLSSRPLPLTVLCTQQVLSGLGL